MHVTLWLLLLLADGTTPPPPTPDVSGAGVAGWATSAMTGGVLGWFLLKYLPRQEERAEARDKIFREEIAKKDATIQLLIDEKDKIINSLVNVKDTQIKEMLSEKDRQLGDKDKRIESLITTHEAVQKQTRDNFQNVLDRAWDELQRSLEEERIACDKLNSRTVASIDKLSEVIVQLRESLHK